MLPTRRGVAMLLIAAVLCGMAWATQIGWLYLAVVSALLLVSLPLPWLSLRSLAAQRGVLKPGALVGADVHEGKAVRVVVAIRNQSWLPKLLFTLVDFCPFAPNQDADQVFLVTALGSNGRVLVSYDTLCHRRGIYTFGPVLVESSAPFGLFRYGRELETPLEVTVLPQVLPMPSLLSLGLREAEPLSMSRSRAPGEFRGVRDFQSGDPDRNIHWRASARRGRLVVKEFDI